MSSKPSSPTLIQEDPLSSVLKIIEDLALGKFPHPPRITKYELARIVAARAKQLVMGAKPLVDPKEVGSYDPVVIAYEEVKRRLLPFIVIRTLPSGRQIRLRLKELLELSEKFGYRV